MLVLAVFGAALLPATATADDASVFAAYHGHDAEAQEAFANYRRAVRAARRAGRNVTDDHLRAIIDADRRIIAVTDQVIADVNAQPASTPAGTRARTYALKELTLFNKANQLEAVSYEQLIAGRVRASDRSFKQGLRALRRAQRYGRRAARTFDSLGLRQ